MHHDIVTFDPACTDRPAGIASQLWKNQFDGSDGACYHFDASGQLHRKSLGSNLDFISRDACGCFVIHTLEIAGMPHNEHLVTFHNGQLIAVARRSRLPVKPGFFYPPKWELAGASEFGVCAALDQLDQQQNINLIHSARQDPTLRGGTPSSELMLALALCVPARLNGASPQAAWRALNPAQRAAVISWADQALEHEASA